MSHDLYLCPKDAGAFDKAAFAALFAGRAHYEVGDGVANYANDDSGVYFSVEHSAGEDDDEEARLRAPHIVFSLNFFRPDYFVLEASDRLADLPLDRLSVFDPQQHGDMVESAFDEAAYVAGWRRGNAAAYRIMPESGIPVSHRLPRAVNTAVWRWNYDRGVRQDVLGEDVYVPLVMLLDTPGEVQRAFSWSLDVPTIVPDAAEHAILVAPPEAPGLIGRLRARERTRTIHGVVAIETLAPFIAEHASGHRLLSAVPAGSRHLAGIIAAAEPVRSRLHADQVLDAETLAEANG